MGVVTARNAVFLRVTELGRCDRETMGGRCGGSWLGLLVFYGVITFAAGQSKQEYVWDLSS